MVEKILTYVSDITGDQNIRNQNIIHMQCMVQDMFDPEYFSSNDKIATRMTYYCTPIPGINDWVNSKKTLDYDLKHKGYLVKVYDVDDSTIKLNDIVDIEGIVQQEVSEQMETEQSSADQPSKQGDQAANEYINALASESIADDQDKQYPIATHPRIHVISMKKLDHLNPLVTDRLPFCESIAPKEFFVKMRSELHAILSQILFGDSLAADYLLCNMLSQIYTRKDVMSIGSFTINLFNLPKITPSELKVYSKSTYHVLSKLFTQSVYFPMTLDTLNKEKFIPLKDYQNNKLQPGLLQLPIGTHMLIDETAMQTGQLAAEGVQNLTTIGELIKWQHVKYDFKYHSLEMGTDIPIVILSEGKSLLPSNYRIPLKVSLSVFVFNQVHGYLQSYLFVLIFSPLAYEFRVRRLLLWKKFFRQLNNISTSIYSIIYENMSRWQNIYRTRSARPYNGACRRTLWRCARMWLPRCHQTICMRG